MRAPAPLAFALLLAGCGGAPPTPEPEPGPVDPERVADPDPIQVPPIEWEGTGAKGQYLPNRMWVLAPIQGVGLRPRHTAHARLVIPAGRAEGPPDVAELTALELVHLGDPRTGRPPLMELVASAGGRLDIQVEDHSTTFRLMAPTDQAPELLDQLFSALGDTSPGPLPTGRRPGSQPPGGGAGGAPGRPPPGGRMAGGRQHTPHHRRPGHGPAGTGSHGGARIP